MNKNENESNDELLYTIIEDEIPYIKAEERQRKIILAKNMNRNKIYNYYRRALLIEHDPEYLSHVGDAFSSMGFSVDMHTDINNFYFPRNTSYEIILVRWLYFNFIAHKLRKSIKNLKIYVLLLEEKLTEENKTYFLDKGAFRVLGMP